MVNFRAIVERFLRRGLRPIVWILVRLNISPNALSFFGFCLVMISVFLFVMDSFVAAGVTFLIGSLFDVLDGELARTGHRVTSFGSVLDSILDRFSEGIVLIAFAWYFADRGETVGVVITMLGMLGSIATSYVRARAEAIGTTCTVGWVTRSERVLIIAVGMFSGQIFLAVSILFLVTTLTVIQRVLHVRSLLVQKDKVSSDKLYDE